jgi:hypothetical protein
MSLCCSRRSYRWIVRRISQSTHRSHPLVTTGEVVRAKSVTRVATLRERHWHFKLWIERSNKSSHFHTLSDTYRVCSLVPSLQGRIPLCSRLSISSKVSALFRRPREPASDVADVFFCSSDTLKMTSSFSANRFSLNGPW